jgi:hypothetical protein
MGGHREAPALLAGRGWEPVTQWEGLGRIRQAVARERDTGQADLCHPDWSVGVVVTPATGLPLLSRRALRKQVQSDQAGDQERSD